MCWTWLCIVISPTIPFSRPWLKKKKKGMQHWPEEKYCNIGKSLLKQGHSAVIKVEGSPTYSCELSRQGERRVSKPGGCGIRQRNSDDCQNVKNSKKISDWQFGFFVLHDMTHIENDSLLWFARTRVFLKVAPTWPDESTCFYSAAAQQTIGHRCQMTTIKAGGLLGTELK